MKNRLISPAVISTLLSLLVSFMGCSTPRGLYEDAVEIVNQPAMPDGSDVQDALEDLDYAIEIAKSDLGDDEDTCSPCRHDQTAYFIPLSSLAKARLHQRLNQITEQEEACWQAVRDAEQYLGAYVCDYMNTSATGQHMYANFSVYFRREKIRRHAFTLLKETYRQAGERDLEKLMRAQIGFSDIYLRSPVAHNEEEFIRTVENSDWLREFDEDQENVEYGITAVLMAMAMAAQTAAYQQAQADMQAQSMATTDPAVRADLQNQMQMMNMQMQMNMQQMMQTAQQMAEAHEAALENIQQQYQNTVIGALSANFEMLELSDEVKNLQAFIDLRKKKEAFDNYVARQGFDQKAAEALQDIRTSLDKLTIDLQKRRRQR